MEYHFGQAIDDYVLHYRNADTGGSGTVGFRLSDLFAGEEQVYGVFGEHYALFRGEIPEQRYIRQDVESVL
jgi:hypothetical protein